MDDLTIYHIKDELRALLRLRKENSILSDEIKFKQSVFNKNQTELEDIRNKISASMVRDKCDSIIVNLSGGAAAVLIELDNEEFSKTSIRVLNAGKLD